MTRRWGISLAAGALGACALLLVTLPGVAGPVGGSVVGYRKIEGRSQIVLDKREASLGKQALFKGGQRACVIVMGDHDPVVPLVVEVRDEQGNLVARDEPAKGADKADEPGNDIAAAIWYPPRDGYYSITIKNLGSQFNKCWIAVK